jgi:hypothetical protein
MENITRLQIDILQSQLEELERLRKHGGLRSKRELFDTAFTFLKWAVKKKAQGVAVGSMNADGTFVELEMPFLEMFAAETRKESSEGASKEVAASGSTAASAQAVAAGAASGSHNGNSSGGNIRLARKNRTA